MVKPITNDDSKSKENANPHAFDNFGILGENELHINNNLDRLLANKEKEEEEKPKQLEVKTEEKNIINNIQNLNVVVSNSANFNITNSNNQTQTINNPNTIINQNFNKQSYLQDIEIRKKNVEATKKEFNDLVDFLNIRSSDEKVSSANSGQFFKIDLFSSNSNKKPNSNKINDKDEDYDIIEIERYNNANVNKVKNMFDDFDLNDNNQEQDDLLDLMDLACKK